MDTHTDFWKLSWIGKWRTSAASHTRVQTSSKLTHLMKVPFSKQIFHMRAPHSSECASSSSATTWRMLCDFRRNATPPSRERWPHWSVARLAGTQWFPSRPCSPGERSARNWGSRSRPRDLGPHRQRQSTAFGRCAWRAVPEATAPAGCRTPEVNNINTILNSYSISVSE